MNFFLTLICLSLFFSIESANEVCADGQFTCNDGRCITNDWVCDGARDCSDGSDEVHEACDRHLNKNSSCFGNQPECKKHGLTRCIPHEWLCDGHPDCDAGEDEYNCTSIDWFRQPESLMRKYQSLLADKSTTTHYFTYCSTDEYRCESSGNCLTLSEVCDGKMDCGKGEDEANCTRNGTGKIESSKNVTTTTLVPKMTTTTTRSGGSEKMSLDKILMPAPTTVTTPATTTKKTTTTTAPSSTTTTKTTTTTPSTTTTPQVETMNIPIIHIQPTLPSSSYVLPTTTSTITTTTTSPSPRTIVTTQKVVARTFATQLHTTQPPKIVVKQLNDSWSNSTTDKERLEEESMTTRAPTAAAKTRSYGRNGIGKPVRFVKGIPIEPVNYHNGTWDFE